MARGIDSAFYVSKPNQEERDAGLGESNPHPTLKPIALSESLGKLLLPPESYAPRRLFVPFAGAGSEMIGGMQAGWEEIVGIELIEEYAEVANQRLAWWAAQPKQLSMF